MILVDVYVPSVDKEYNFSLNEGVPVSTIIAEITEMIAQKEQTQLRGEQKYLNLCCRDKGSIFPAENTLEECGIATGSSLILI
ncbi:MAG: hypothetical protein KBH85_03250 [Lachnospiraceae bacterium]|nr:hypothetical protein [Lachnospiraceae bacterium]